MGFLKMMFTGWKDSSWWIKLNGLALLLTILWLSAYLFFWKDISTQGEIFVWAIPLGIILIILIISEKGFKSEIRREKLQKNHNHV